MSDGTGGLWIPVGKGDRLILSAWNVCVLQAETFAKGGSAKGNFQR
jgi:hypothetical protein